MTLQQAKDQAAREFGFDDILDANVSVQDDIEYDKIINRAIEIYAEKVGDAQRTEGIREGFEAARDGHGFKYTYFQYDTVDDYLNSKQ